MLCQYLYGAQDPRLKTLENLGTTTSISLVCENNDDDGKQKATYPSSNDTFDVGALFSVVLVVYG
jgi:hypothetical protein